MGIRRADCCLALLLVLAGCPDPGQPVWPGEGAEAPLSAVAEAPRAVDSGPGAAPPAEDADPGGAVDPAAPASGAEQVPPDPGASSPQGGDGVASAIGSAPGEPGSAPGEPGPPRGEAGPPSGPPDQGGAGERGGPLPEEGGVVVPSVSPEIQAALDQGLALFRADDLDGALAAFTAVIDAHPETFMAYDQRSMVYYNQSAFAKVAADCTKAIDLARAGGYFAIACPTQCLTRRGASFLNLERWSEALVDFEEALTYRPDEGFLYFERGRALFGLGRMEAAKADFERSLKLAPDHPVSSQHSPYFLKKIEDPDYH